ncbi:MAG: threonyl-tRNA synthetase editing domain-containing protein, partial [Candidatus Nitrosocosmicus sp.]
MRILQLHVDYVEYLPTNKEIRDAENNISKEKKRIEDTIVILISIEKNDNNDQIINDFIRETKAYSEKIKCYSILLYPYSHLSSNLESPKEAFNILNILEKRLKKESYNLAINRAPFGWTKELNLKIKGHPLAENSKTFYQKESEMTIVNEVAETNKDVSISPPAAAATSSTSITSNALVAEDSLRS